MFKVVYFSLFLILMVNTQSLLAKKTDGQFEIKILKNEVSVIPKKNYHLNKDAPAFFQIDKNKIAPKIKLESNFKFLIQNQLSNTFKGTLSFYICDDQKTVCEQQKTDMTLSLNNEELKFKDKNNSNSRLIELKKDDQTTKNKEQNYSLKKDKVLTNKKTLYVFSAPWCPACIRLYSETLNQSQVKKELNKINLIKINIDLIENEKLSERFGIKAIPTMVLVDEKDQEIYRWLDFQEKKSLVSSFKLALKEIKASEEIKKLADAGNKEASLKLAYNEYAKMNFSEAAKYFSVATNEVDVNFKNAALVQSAAEKSEEDAKEQENYISVLTKAIQETHSFVDKTRWSIDLFELKKTKSKSKNLTPAESEEYIKVETELKNLLNSKDIEKEFKASTVGEISGFEKLETLAMLSKLYELASNEEKNKEIKKQLEALALENKTNLKEPGKVITTIYYLSLTKTDEAKKNINKYYLELTSNYDKTYVYYEKYANYLVKQKLFQEALDQINKALQYSEGNFQKLQLAKVKILKELGKKGEVFALISEIEPTLNLESKKHKKLQTQLEQIKNQIQK